MKPAKSDLYSWARGHRLFSAYVAGLNYQRLSQKFNLPIPIVRRMLKYYLRTLWISTRKWRLAESRCEAMAMELRMLRLGRECPEDPPIESFDPPAKWLAAFKRVGVDTVNQLRSAKNGAFTIRGFPQPAIEWAIMAMDERGLSHRLIMPPQKGSTVIATEACRAGRRRQSEKVHICGCGRKIKGNGYYSHALICPKSGVSTHAPSDGRDHK